MSVFEANTVRIWLTDLSHDIAGDIGPDATVTYTVYRAAGTTLTSGSMSYYAGRGWNAIFVAPTLAAGLTEQLRVMVHVVSGGATADFRAYVTVSDEGAA